MAGAEKVTELDELTSAVQETARHCAGHDWGASLPPRLFALTRRNTLAEFDAELPTEIKEAAPDSLIPIEQDLLPEGEPAEVLARVRWSEEVVGCVLVTEVIVLFSDPGPDESGTPAVAQGTVGREEREGRLTVGVLREPNDQAACCLQLRNEDELIIRNDLADELVTALLGTFLS